MSGPYVLDLSKVSPGFRSKILDKIYHESFLDGMDMARDLKTYSDGPTKDQLQEYLDGLNDLDMQISAIRRAGG